MTTSSNHLAPLRILPRTENLERIRAYVGSAIVSTFLTDGERNGIVLAVDEAVANIVTHAAALGPTTEIELRIVVSDHDIAIEIRDQSAAFDLRDVDQPDMAAYFREMRPGGLGIALIRRVMDQIDYVPASADIPFNRLILRKHHRSAS